MKINFVVSLVLGFLMSANSEAQVIAKTNPADAPNLACDYINMADGWHSTGATFIYTANASGIGGVFKNTEMDLTVSRMGGPILHGACLTNAIKVDDKTAIVKIATYTTEADNFSFDANCDVVENVEYKTVQHFKAKVVPGTTVEATTDLLKLINYVMTPADIKAWSKDEKTATAAAQAKCLSLVPGSIPDTK